MRISAACGRLSRMQTVALMARLESRTHVDAARKIHLSPDALRMRWHRGLAKLSTMERSRYLASLRRGGRLVRVRPMFLSFGKC